MFGACTGIIYCENTTDLRVIARWGNPRYFTLIYEFVPLSHRERYSKPKWGNAVAEEYKLTDKDIEGFVRGIQPVILNAMYTNSLSTTIPLQCLAPLAPEIIIPPLIERLHGAFDTLTEPHKLTASMNAVVAVARSLVSSHAKENGDLCSTEILPTCNNCRKILFKY